MKVFIFFLFLSQYALAGQAEIETAITKGVDFLIQHQNKNGSWGSPHRTKGLNIFTPLPDGHQAYHAASSALALHGLLESQDRRPATLAAIQKGEDWLLSVLPKQRSINRSASYNIWAHSYGLRALSSLYREYEAPEKRREYVRQAKLQIKKLQEHENVNRGWGHYDFDHKTAKPSGLVMSFTTATAMLAMIEASKLMEIKLPEDLKKRTLFSLQEMRTPDFSYVYSRSHRYRPRHPINRPAGSLGRSQACNAASRALGDTAITDEVLSTWLQRLFDRNG